MRMLWKPFVASVVALLVAVVALIVVYRVVQQKNQEIATNTTFTTQVPGYDIALKSTVSLEDFFTETKFYSLEHTDGERKISSSINRVNITLTDRQLPLYKVFFSATPESRELSYASDYTLINNSLEIYVYVNPKLLADTSPEVTSRVEQAINSQIIRTLLMSIKPTSESQEVLRNGDLTQTEQYISRYVFEKEPNDLAFRLVKDKS